MWWEQFKKDYKALEEWKEQSKLIKYKRENKQEYKKVIDFYNKFQGGNNEK